LQLRHNFVERRIEGKQRYQSAILAGLDGTAPLPEPRGESLEELENMIASMIYNEQRIYQLNVINNGAIANVMPGVCVETPVMIDQYGFHPVQFGCLPPAIAGWVNLLGTVQDLTVRAAIEGNRQYALQALLLDPMCYHMEIAKIESMLAELLEANRKWLPAFFG
jgi:alpha-galactosidase/6-phospho-beta-glucosidase family protein